MSFIFILFLLRIMITKTIVVIAAIAATLGIMIGMTTVPSYARVPGQDYDYCYNYTLADGSTGFECVFHQDKQTSKSECERGREARLAENPGATATKCKLVN